MLSSKSASSCTTLASRILRYVKGSLSAGLQLGLGAVDQLTAYSDAN
jgi:hypothetical protein